MEQAAPPVGRLSRDADCPACHRRIDGSPRGLAPTCPHCGATFRSPLAAAALSAALPGAGHFYLRRRGLALAELGIGLLLFSCAIARLAVVFVAVIHETATPFDLLRTCVPWGIVLACYSLLDGVFTWVVSRHRVVLSLPAEQT
ncbi:MAG TPA: hypothetical protein VFE84_05115 [Patescibacteria group bacterium]|nr:hypothetical protein [Patescibacteria group bacterium]